MTGNPSVKRKAPKALTAASLLCLILLVSGCAAPYTIGLQKLQDKEPCCETIYELGYDKLRFGQSISIEMGGQSKAFNFDTGKSFFAAFELPYYVDAYGLVIRSFMIGDRIDRAYIFHPHVMTLDADYNVVRTFGKETFKLRKTIMGESWGLPYKLEGRIEFNEKDRDERYMVVMTTEEMLLMKSSVETMKLVPLVMPGLGNALRKEREHGAPRACGEAPPDNHGLPSRQGAAR